MKTVYVGQLDTNNFIEVFTVRDPDTGQPVAPDSTPTAVLRLFNGTYIADLTVQSISDPPDLPVGNYAVRLQSGSFFGYDDFSYFYALTVTIGAVDYYYTSSLFRFEISPLRAYLTTATTTSGVLTVVRDSSGDAINISKFHDDAFVGALVSFDILYPDPVFPTYGQGWGKNVRRITGYDSVSATITWDPPLAEAPDDAEIKIIAR